MSGADHVVRSRRVYSESAARYAATVGTAISPTFEASLDRAILEVFAASCRAVGGAVIDAGCGTGRVARFVADLDLDVLGVDVAPGMVDAARRAHPDLRFELAELTDLPAADSSIVGAAYWYSIITTPPSELDAVWSELARVLASGGSALVAFQSGAGEEVTRPDAYGTDTDLTLYRHSVDSVCAALSGAGLTVESVTRRVPQLPHETTVQTFVLAARPTASPAGRSRSTSEHQAAPRRRSTSWAVWAGGTAD